MVAKKLWGLLGSVAIAGLTHQEMMVDSLVDPCHVLGSVAVPSLIHQKIMVDPHHGLGSDYSKLSCSSGNDGGSSSHSGLCCCPKHCTLGNNSGSSSCCGLCGHLKPCSLGNNSALFCKTVSST